MPSSAPRSRNLFVSELARTLFTLIMLVTAWRSCSGIVGVYGVISYSVSQLTWAMGIRIALSGRQQELTAMFVRHALWLTSAGAL